MALFVTFNGLHLETIHEDGGEYIVRLMAPAEPTRAKIVYHGPDQLEQQKAYREIKAHYQEREKQEKAD